MARAEAETNQKVIMETQVSNDSDLGHRSSLKVIRSSQNGDLF